MAAIATVVSIQFMAAVPLAAITASQLVEPQLSEVYPNPPNQPETGYEFIELYNPNDTVLILEGYSVRLKGKAAAQPLSGELPPRGYKAVVTSFALVNTGAVIELVLSQADGTQQIIEELTYGSVSDSDVFSWSNYADGWKLALPTPDKPNYIAEQTASPDGDTAPSDVCPNLDGIQPQIPDSYQLLNGACLPVVSEASKPLVITELLPDPSTDERSDEYIELYNPNDTTISLNGYTLRSGSSLTYSYQLTDVAVEPGSYMVVYSRDSKLVLANSGSRVQLAAPDGSLLDEVTYKAAPTDRSWSLIEGEWVITTELTPGQENKYSPPAAGNDQLVSVAPPALAPCDSNEERNPATNRCRRIATQLITTPELSPCRAGEVRNPLTNRCRKAVVATASFTPCAEGQERNPATNRCRSAGVVAAATSTKPCLPGQERNPATNRCRKAVVTTAAASMISTKDGAQAAAGQFAAAQTLQWLAVGVLGAGALGYGLYEWRSELVNGATKLRMLRRR